MPLSARSGTDQVYSPGRTVRELHLDRSVGVEFEPGRRAVHVHLQIIDDDLVHPDIAEQIGHELVFETAGLAVIFQR